METVTKSLHEMSSPKLPLSWFQRPPEQVARELIGSTMHLHFQGHAARVLRIVETEAYLAEGDGACHAATGRTARNAPMFDAGGVLYLYLIYGMHICANIVTEQQGKGSAVLLRAAEVLSGMESVQRERGETKARKDWELLRGPGNLCRGLGWKLDLNRQSCHSTELWFEAATEPVLVHCSERIGIQKSAELPLRFYDAQSKAVSAHRRGWALDHAVSGAPE